MPSLTSPSSQVKVLHLTYCVTTASLLHGLFCSLYYFSCSPHDLTRPDHGLDFLKHCEVVLEWGLFKYNMLKSYNGFVCPRWRETGFLPQFQMVTKLTSQSVNHARSVPNTQWYQPFVSTDCNTQVPFQKVTKSALGTKLGWREYRDWVSPESIFKFSSF